MTPVRVLAMLMGVFPVVGCQPGVPPAESTRGQHGTTAYARLDDPAALLLREPADVADPGAAGPIAVVRANLAAFEVQVFDTGRSVELPAARRSLLGPSAAVRALRVSTRVAGEARPVDHTVWVTTTVRDNRARLAALSDGPDAPAGDPVPLWLLEPIAVTRGRGAAVVTTRGHDPASWLAGMERAAEDVASIGREPGFLVAEMPSSSSQLGRLTGTPGLRAVGAACWPFGEGSRILVNPAHGAAATGDARQVLLTHEAVHAATRSPHHRWPGWFVEGYADHVAVAAHPSVAPALDDQLRTALRAGAPATVPGEEEFGPSAPGLAATYGRARIGVRVLGDAAHRIQAQISDGATFDDALRNNGWTQATHAAATADALARLKE